MREYICKEVPTEYCGYITIETELIRCRDCKYFTDCGCVRMEGMVYPKEYDFCSKAERK